MERIEFAILFYRIQLDEMERRGTDEQIREARRLLKCAEEEREDVTWDAMIRDTWPGDLK